MRLTVAAPVDLITAAGFVLATFVCARTLATNKVYRTPAHRLTPRVLRRIFVALVETLAVVTAIGVAVGAEGVFTREALLTWFGLAAGLIVSYRTAMALFLGTVLRRGFLRRRIAIYGGDAQGIVTIEHPIHSDDETLPGGAKSGRSFTVAANADPAAMADG